MFDIIMCDPLLQNMFTEIISTIDRHITLIHLRNRFVTAVETARRTPGIRNNRISDQTVRNQLRQSIDSGGLTRLRTRLPSSSHKCWMGF
jgi:hypothetical protein